MQIVGLPDNVNDPEEELKQLVKMSKEKLGIKLKASDISTISRLGKKRDGKTRNVNVTFKDKTLREKVYQQRKKLITHQNGSKNIYINDCLTKHRQSLLYTCRKQVRAKKLFAAWSQGGNILIRREEKGKIVQVLEHQDLTGSLTEDNAQSRSLNDASSTYTHLSNYSFSYDSDF